MPQNNPEHPSPYTSEAEEVLSPDFPFSTVLAKQMRDALRQLFSDEESGKSGDIVWVDGDTILEALIALDPERLAPIRDSILPWLQARNILQFQKKPPTYSLARKNVWQLIVQQQLHYTEQDEDIRSSRFPGRAGFDPERRTPKKSALPPESDPPPVARERDEDSRG